MKAATGSARRALALLLALFLSLLAPRSAGAQECEPRWSDEFPSADLNGAVRALVEWDDGRGGGPALYAGGFFTRAGGLPAGRVARWDGERWSALGEGVNGDVYTLAVVDDGGGGGPALYVGGDFTVAGDVPANRIARWDGESWSAVGGGVDGRVRAIAQFDDGGGSGPALYAAGLFTHAGDVQLNGIARWDGQAWLPLGEGLAYGPDRPFATGGYTLLATDGPEGPRLVVGGYFRSAGDAPANCIAAWDGTAWHALGEGMSGTTWLPSTYVVTLTSAQDESGVTMLYAGGSFASAGGVPARNAAAWDGAAWSALGAGPYPFGYVTSLAWHDDGEGLQLCAASNFENETCVTRWDGETWTVMRHGCILGPVRTLAVFHDKAGASLAAGGEFTRAGPFTSRPFIARWAGAGWRSIKPYHSGPVLRLTVFDDGEQASLYAAGPWATGPREIQHVGRWDGSEWSPLAGGPDGEVRTISVFEAGDLPALFLGGSFAGAGGIDTPGIAQWNGKAWSGVGGTLVGSPPSARPTVRTLAVLDDGDGPALYAAGSFTAAGDVPASNIARWNGEVWSALGAGLGMFSEINALAMHDDGDGPKLYAAGRRGFGDSVMRWDGKVWSPVGPLWGVGGDLESFNDGSGPALYIVGANLTIGSSAVRSVARFRDGQWEQVGEGLRLDAHTTALTVFDDGSGPSLYASSINAIGAGGTPADRLARWNGTSWSPYGGGFDGPVLTMTTLDNTPEPGQSLWLGGDFTRAGGTSSERIARLIGCPPCPADWDRDGRTDSNDFFAFLTDYFGGAARADLNGDAQITSDDLFAYLGAFTDGCP